MRLVIESTDRIVQVNGVDARLWEGKTGGGVQVVAFITRVMVRADQPNEAFREFERELQETRPPSPDAAAVPSRLIL